MSSQNWVTHKFGGTSLAEPDRIRIAADLVLPDFERGKSVAIVVSALGGVTDKLIEALNLARERNEEYHQILDQLQARHFNVIQDLFSKSEVIKALKDAISNDLKDLRDLLRAIYLTRSYHELNVDMISGYGEIWSAQIFCHYFKDQKKKNCSWLNARDVLTVSQHSIGPFVDWENSPKKLQTWLDSNPDRLLVITGYLASLPDGVPTTLKRNGSDFSGSIFANLLNAESLTIWTDVDGIYSADPRRVPEAIVLKEVSYNDAMELAYFGAKVIHPNTMNPVIKKNIPVRIRNSMNASHPGTIVQKSTSPIEDQKWQVTGFSTVEGISLINLEGTGMIGVPGVSQRLFGSLRDVGVSVMMISQASSEHSICIAVRENQGEIARKTILEAFDAEMKNGKIQKIELIEPCSILAVVGERMVETPGVATRFFSALSRAGVNVRAIAQGSSERNISIVIDKKDSTKALRAVHSGFYLSDQTLSIGVVGTGLIGSTFLNQLNERANTLDSQYQIDLRVRGLTRSKTMILEDKSIDLANWKSEFEARAIPANMDQFLDHVQASHLPHSVIIDCTASEEIALEHPKWLARGFHVITPNKKGNSANQSVYEEIREKSHSSHSHYLYETTVGAGLPIISTLKELINTGDKIISIEGIFSGTLAYIFNTVTKDNLLSDVIRVAKEKGFTEPDPRDDLSGTDVARKLLILAREMGLRLELEDIQVESLVPEELQDEKSIPAFLEGLKKHDQSMKDRIVEAENAGKKLRYVGRVDAKTRSASVKLDSYPNSHAFANIGGSDNIIAFTTSRYNEQPLIVRGPGAGPDVTAGGIFADLLKLASYLGANA